MVSRPSGRSDSSPSRNRPFSEPWLIAFWTLQSVWVIVPTVYQTGLVLVYLIGHPGFIGTFWLALTPTALITLLLTSVEIYHYYSHAPAPTNLTPKAYLLSQTTKLTLWTALWTFFVVRAALKEEGWQDAGSRAVLGVVDCVMQLPFLGAWVYAMVVVLRERRRDGGAGAGEGEEEPLLRGV